MPTFTLNDDRYIDQVLTKVQLGYNNEATTPALVWLTLDARSVAFDEGTTTLTTEGTTETYEQEVTDRITVTVENSVLQRALHKAMIGDPDTGVSGIAERYGYDGSLRGKQYALKLTYTANDLDGGATVTFEQTFHKMQGRRYTPRDGATRKAVPLQRVAFTAIKTTTDLLGVAIDGLQHADGDYYTEDKVA